MQNVGSTALSSALLVLFTGSAQLPTPLPQDLAAVLACAAALPAGQYAVLCSDQDDSTDHLPSSGQLVARWDQLAGNSGYGSVELVPGGLLISYAGSQGASASSVWVVAS